MTWWIKTDGGQIELMDNERLVAICSSNDDANEILNLQDLAQRQSDLLKGVVDAIRGAPAENSLWSHHDAPQLAQRMMAQLNRLGVFLALLHGTLPIYVDTAHILREELERFEKECTK